MLSVIRFLCKSEAMAVIIVDGLARKKPTNLAWKLSTVLASYRVSSNFVLKYLRNIMTDNARPQDLTPLHIV